MTNLRVSTNANGTLILHMPAGEFKWKRSGSWSTSYGIGRPVLNALVNYCEQREAKMSKKEIMESLTNPAVLSALFFAWDQPVKKPGNGATKDDFNVGDKVTLPQRSYFGEGTIIAKKLKKVVVKFQFDHRRWTVPPDMLVKA